jgi:predicted enzyme related to lactoylglutathione lyase
MSEFRGRFLWHELMTNDPKAAQAFYMKVVGWGLQEWTGMDKPYWMWTRGETPIGGLMPQPPDAQKAGTPPCWLAYIGTPAVDETLRKAEGLGAKALAGPMDIPTVGRIAILQDPQGAAFAIYAPARTPEAEAEAQVMDFSWHELATSDYEAAFAFYEKLFGWKRSDAVDMGPLGTYQMYGRGDRTYGGMYNKPKEMPAPPHWLLYTRIPDINEAAETVKGAGGQVLNGPMEVPGGDWIVQCLDPLGAAFALHATKA